jgi:hypothetical protein
MTSYGDDNSLLSTTVYGEFINADVPPDFPGFSGNVYIPQYAYAQFDRNVSVFGNIYCRQLQGFTTDVNGNITSTGALNLSGTSVNVTGNFFCGGTNYTTLVPSIYGNVSSLQTTVSTLAPKASPMFTGTVTIPTPATNDNSTVAASTAYVKAQGYATTASPTFTGTVTIPTVATADNSTAAASTAWVNNQGYITSGTTSGSFAGYASNNAWTGTNTFNSYLPTSTLTPSADAQLTTKVYVDGQVATKTTLAAVQSNNNSFTGTTAFNSSLPTSTLTPSAAAQLTTKTYVDTQVATKTTLAAVQANANNFTAQQTFSAGAALADQQLRLRGTGDGNHYLQYTTSRDGVEVCGFSGGRLGYVEGQPFQESLGWNNTGVVVRKKVGFQNSGSFYLGSIDENCNSGEYVNGVSIGTGDGGSDSTFNLALRTWQGVGIINTSNDGQTGANRCKHYWNARDGNYTAKGSINASSLTITESTGNSGSENSGSITLRHNDNGGVSSIIFPSKNNAGSDYGYIRYRDDVGNTLTGEAARLEIGLENDTGEDFLVLQKNGGRTYVNGQLLLSNDANHNIRVMSTSQLTSNTTINPSGYQATMNYYDIIVDNLTFTFDLNNMIQGMSFTFCNRVGSTMKFTTTLGQNIALIDRDNGVFSSAQTMSLFNTRRVNFVYMNNRVIETFRYP